MANPYQIPDSVALLPPVSVEELIHSRADSPTTRFLAIVAIGATSAAISIWWPNFAAGGMYAGKSVDLTLFGNMLFLGLGFLVGLIVGSLIGVFNLTTAQVLDSRKQKQNWLISMIASAILSPIAAFFVVVVLSIIFFAMPEEIFRIMFDVPS
ncbi:MAG: hypothetical protein JNL67_11590 [Planctomycetaceae bacterium]|nr:hypothetical protein [Planctomycetaceae bacterium]